MDTGYQQPKNVLTVGPTIHSLTKIYGAINCIPSEIIIDSGSAASLVDSKFVDPCEIQPCEIKLVGADGGCLSLLGTCKVIIELANAPPVQFQVYIIQDFRFNALLGTDFHRRYKSILNYETNIYEFGANAVPLLNLEAVEKATSEKKDPVDINSADEGMHERKEETENGLTEERKDERYDKTADENFCGNEHKETGFEEIEIEMNSEICTIYGAIRNTIVEPNSVKYIEVEMTRPSNAHLMFEPFQKLMRQKGLLVPKMFVHKRYGSYFRVPICNPNPVPVALKRSRIGRIVEVEEKESDTDCVNIAAVQDANSKEDEKLEAIYDSINPNLNPDDRSKLFSTCNKFKNVFAAKGEIGEIKGFTHKITLKPDAVPVKRMPYKKPAKLAEFERETVKELLQKGIIEPSCSPWSMGTVIVEKGHVGEKGTKIEPRFCVDYRPLNRATMKDSYPLPDIQSIIDWVGENNKFVTLLDANKGFWSIPMEESSKLYTAFCTQNGLYQWKRMPFGLCNASASFQRIMETILCGLLWGSVLVFVDDIIVIGKSIEDHCKNLEQVLLRLQTHNVKLNTRKCKIAYNELRILGHIFTPEGMKPDPQKVEAIKLLKPPTNCKEIKQFLGAASYYRRYIKGFTNIARPLQMLLRKDAKFQWTDVHQKHFEQLKTALTTAPVLCHYDPKKPVVVHTDASDQGIGGVLMHINENNREQPIAYTSRALTPAETRYNTTEKEMLAIVHALRAFHTYLYSRSFSIYTDHQPICGIKFAKNNKSKRLMKWALELQDYDCEIIYKSGNLNYVPDALSRLPTLTLVLAVENQNLQAMQEIDKFCKNILSNLAKNPKYVIKRHLLYKITKQGPKLVIPKCLQSELLTEAHDIPISGHLGVLRTVQKLKSKYYWKSMDADVYNYISTCDSCQAKKKEAKKRAGLMQHIPVTNPFEIVSTDVCGPFPRTTKGNLYIVHAIDIFTKWVETRAIPDQTAATIVKFLEEQVFCRHGSPKFLISDNGPCYISNLLEAHSKQYGVRQRFTTPYHSEGNGLSERFNRTMEEMLSHYISNSNQATWDAVLPQATFAYNTTVQASTKKTPFELVYGRIAAYPYDFPIEADADSRQDIMLKLNIMRENVRDILRKEQGKYKQREDRKRRHFVFNPGDLILVHHSRVMPGMAKKLCKPYSEQCVVEERLTDLVYKVKSTTTGKLYQVHIKRMKPYKLRENSSSSSIHSNSDIEKQREKFLSDNDTVTHNSSSSQFDTISSDSDVGPPNVPYVTRYGRTINKPKHLNDYEL